MDTANKKRFSPINTTSLVIVRVITVSFFLIHIATNTVGTIHAAISCNIKSYGATGNGTTKDTTAIQNAINACGGGGIVTFPSGKYLTAPLFLLKSNITLNILSGATILGSETISDYTVKSDQKVATPTLALINSYHVTDITITGGGVIDGQGAMWWASGKSTHDRPRLVELAYGNNIRVSNITLENAGAMHLYLKVTSNVIIDGVTIRAPSNSPNTDGIVPNSSNNVLIKNCNISVGDDNIAIKSGPTPVPSYNIQVINCKFGSGHGVSLGSDLQGGVHDVMVENSTFEGTTNGIRIKSARTKGGKVTVIVYKNLTMTNVNYPLWFSGYYPDIPSSDSAPQPITATTPNYSNITVSNLTATGATDNCKIVGVPEMPISALTLDAVKITAKKGSMIRNATGLVNSSSGADSSCLIPPGPPAALNLPTPPTPPALTPSIPSTPIPTPDGVRVPSAPNPPTPNPTSSPSTVRIT